MNGVTILFHWNGESHKINLNVDDFSNQTDRFYAYFHIGNDYFYFEDDLEDGHPVLNMPGVWYQPENEEEEDRYFWHPSDLQIMDVDGKTVTLTNNGR